MLNESNKACGKTSFKIK